MSGKGFVRLTIIVMAVSLLTSFIVAQVFGIDIMTHVYVIMPEWCVVIYCFSEGKYHCKYMKYTAFGVAFADTLTRLDYVFDFLSVRAHNLIPIWIIGICIIISFYKAIKHFIRVRKLKRLQKYGPQTK